MRLEACPPKSGVIHFRLTHHLWNPEVAAHPCPRCCFQAQWLPAHWDPDVQSEEVPLRGEYAERWLMW
jgi:hypothetical protein